MVKSAKGVKYKLKAHKTKLWGDLCDLMLRPPNWLSKLVPFESPLKPPSWGYFYLQTSTTEYETLTADNCCCGNGSIPRTSQQIRPHACQPAPHLLQICT